MSKEKAPKGTLIKVLKFISHYKFSVIASLFLAFGSVVLTLYIPLLFGDAIDLILGKGSVDFPGIIRTLGKAGILAAVCAFATWVMNSVNNRITFSVVKDIRNRAYEKINSLPLSYLDTHKSGETVSRIITDADQFSEGLLMGFTQFFTGILTIIGTLILMLMLDWKIALVVAALTPVSLFVAKFVAKHTYRFFSEQSSVRAEQTAMTDEITENLKTVKAFGKEKDSLEAFGEVNERLRKISLKAIFYSSITNPATRFVNAIVYAAVAFTGALAVISGGSISIGVLTCLLSYANQYTKPFNEISGVAAELQNAFACASRVIEILEESPEIPDKKDALIKTDTEGIMEIKDVSFSYALEKKLIENFSLSVKSGQKTAIVGPTGCGKTTFINLLMRFYDVNGGAIYIDGVDIRDITRNSLRSCYGMVLQDTWLMPGSIRDNIKMGKPDATDEEIIEAAKLSHSYSFIKRLPEGLDTFIGEDGGSLSQGQKQLLCITRVMLTDPEILILDEATSSIDTRTEIRVNKAFDTLMKGKTSFIVAHRLSTILKADKILYMENGKILETGTHEELLNKNGKYARLFRSQFEA
ncbi:MAG: ABC transporter ATP-binding protein [Ruminococcaceae bacterium]|nr:ABC transporter ATP-binding protein [Oscillospiraceae bacterium]MBR3595647.1 ABC transporter ATP-binding protein [Clostridia bacterium]